MVPCTFIKEPLDTFVAELRRFFPEADNASLEDSIRSAAQKFIRRSAVLECTMTLSIQKDQVIYPLEVDDCDLMIHAVKSVCKGCIEARLDDRSCYHCGCYTFDIPDPGTLILHHEPPADDEEGMRLTVILSPKRQACAYPKLVYDEHMDAILDGARSIMHMMRGYPWYNPQESALYDNKFKHETNAAMSRQMRRNTQGQHLRIRAERIL